MTDLDPMNRATDKASDQPQTTPAQFALFESECRRLQQLWGLTGWDLRVTCEDLRNDHVGEQRCDTNARRMMVVLAKTWTSVVFPLTDAEIRETARHEMVHCLLEPLDCLAYTRFVTAQEVEAASHEVLQRLMNLLPR